MPHPTLKLGKQPATKDDRDITFKALKQAAAAPLPSPPSRFGHGYAFQDWRMLANDRLGDCVPADMCHATMLWTKLGDPATATFGDVDAVRVYENVSGYSPFNPQSDQGTNMHTAMGIWRTEGIQDSAGKVHKIGAYVSIDPKDVSELMEAAYIFGWVHIGFLFPEYAFDQFEQGQIWDYKPGVDDEPSEGHCVGVTGRTSLDAHNMGVITWGKRQGMSARFYEQYNDEAWVTVSEDELKAGRNERGFDLAGLIAALGQLGIAV